ncbi:MAG TPA: winged helix-turn-helix domain-containing protein [Candidatus Competibacteraceae bacterium]|nr:winged helix-turn-helix domain-containing protein [Candidatus Competibacteraceae bacterium]
MRPQKPFPPGTTERMEQLLKTTRSLDEYRHIQGIYFRAKYGLNAERIADMVGLHVQTVRNLHSAYLRDGEAALHGQGAGGRRQALLSLEEEAALLAELEDAGQQGTLLEVHRVQQAYAERAGQAVARSTVYRLLHRHGWHKLAPRPRHPQGNEAQIQGFKKTLPDS